MILNETFPLADGTSIPKIGFGTWLINGAAATQAVMDAIAAGYRHIDTAWAYGNEKEVARASAARACRARSSMSRRSSMLISRRMKRQSRASRNRSRASISAMSTSC